MELCENEEVYKNNRTKMTCVDSNGYKYSLNVSRVLAGKGHEKFSPLNPYTIDNIKHYIVKNNIDSTLLSETYKNNSTKLDFLCKCGDIFHISWKGFLGGKHYCFKCQKENSLKEYRENKYIEVKQAFANRGYELLSTEYRDIDTELEFICNKHKEYGVQKIQWRSFYYRNCGCHICGRERINEVKRLSEDEAKKFTESKGFEYVSHYYTPNLNKCKTDKRTNITIIRYICPKHREYGVQEITLSALRKSSGRCYYCQHPHTQYNHEKFISDMLHINPTVEIISKYIDMHKNVSCKCKIDGYEWVSTPYALLQGRGCWECGKEKSRRSRCKTDKEFRDEMFLKNPNIEILSEYTGAHDKVKCRCKIDGTIWETAPTTLLGTSIGCPTCVSKYSSERQALSNEEFVERLKNKNPNLEPLEEYINGHTKIKVRCKVHDYTWLVMPSKILSKSNGCPKCQASKNEIKISKVLDDMGIKYESQKKFSDCKDKKSLPFDFYVPSYNTLIEYDGEHHFYPVPRKPNDETVNDRLETTQRHDKIKTQYCKDNNICLLRIPYWEQDNIENILANQFSKIENTQKIS